MKSRITLRAILLILFLLFALILSIFQAAPYLSGTDSSFTAYVYKDGTLIQTIPLNEVDDTQQYLIQISENDYNMIQVIPGAICIIEASCPDKICVNQGYISNSLLPITCLPHHLIIELKADQGALDAITH